MKETGLVSKTKGFTMIEVVITLAVVAILAAILVPIISQNIQSARSARASADVNTIGKAIVQFHQDMGKWPVERVSGGSNMSLLFADTDIDSNGVPDTSTIPAIWNTIPAANCLSLYHNLVNNVNAYSSIQVTESISWNGPYLSSVPPDPWGNPYLVNAQWLWTAGGGNVYVLSPGPRRPAHVETPFNGTPPADSDDIVFRIQ